MKHLAAMVVLIVGPLWGCTTQDYTEASVRQALHERDAAYVKLTQVIARYCRVANESPEERQSCIAEKLTALREEQSAEDFGSTRVAAPHSLDVSAHNQLSHLSCERIRFETTCQRIHPSVTETHPN